MEVMVCDDVVVIVIVFASVIIYDDWIECITPSATDVIDIYDMKLVQVVSAILI